MCGATNDKAETFDEIPLEINMSMWMPPMNGISVTKSLYHRGEVNLESGHIHFEGNVQVGGNVHPSMFVGATGTIRVEGTVSKATVHAVNSIFIEGNVFSSTINVGEQNVIIGDLCRMLEEITVFLLQLKKEILRIENDAAVGSPALKELVSLAFSENYSTFKERIKELIQKVKNRSEILSNEWVTLADKLYTFFIIPVNDQLQSMQTYELLIKEARHIIEKHGTDVSTKSELVIPYAVNSVLYSNGDIQVTTRGIFHCMVNAQQDITVSGVCRGGEITANRKISLQEAGSENGVKTVIRTTGEGSITIGLAHVGTEIQIGNRSHIFSEKRLGVYARLDEQGELIM